MLHQHTLPGCGGRCNGGRRDCDCDARRMPLLPAEAATDLLADPDVIHDHADRMVARLQLVILLCALAAVAQFVWPLVDAALQH